MEKMLSVVEAAKLAGIGKSLMYEAVTSGDITVFNPMGKKLVRIPESALEIGIAKHTRKATG